MKGEAIHPAGLFRRPFYSDVVKAGNTVYIAGQLSRDEKGNVVGAGDFRVQAEKVFENLQLALKAVGANLSKVVSTTAYVTNITYLPILTEIVAKYFGTEAPPNLTVVMVSSLALPEYLLEIQAVAVVE